MCTDNASCTNVQFGFPCAAEFEKKFPGTCSFYCEFCGIYTASQPRCNCCECENFEKGDDNDCV